MVSSVFFLRFNQKPKKVYEISWFPWWFSWNNLRISPRYISLANDPQTEFYVDSWLKNELLFSGIGYAVIEEWAKILV